MYSITLRKRSVCFRRQQFIDGYPCLLGDAFQKIHGRRMHASKNVAYGRLADADPARELCLGRIRRFEIGVECLHMDAESIGNAYWNAIGQTYNDSRHAVVMVKPRSFLERALEALQERYPRQKATQERLAALAGVKQPSVNDWKVGFPAMDTAVRLAENLGVCVEWLFTERGPKYPPKAPRDEIGSLSLIWTQLDDRKKAEVTRFADFLKDSK